VRYVEDGLLISQNGKIQWFGSWQEGQQHLPIGVEVQHYPEQLIVPVTENVKTFYMENNKKLPSIAWNGGIGGRNDPEYVPQYVAAHIHDPYSCHEKLYRFEIESTPQNSIGEPRKDVYLGVPFFLGRFEGTSMGPITRENRLTTIAYQTDLPIDNMTIMSRRTGVRLQLFIN
jgi:hypothetical protein